MKTKPKKINLGDFNAAIAAEAAAKEAAVAKAEKAAAKAARAAEKAAKAEAEAEARLDEEERLEYGDWNSYEEFAAKAAEDGWKVTKFPDHYQVCARYSSDDVIRCPYYEDVFFSGKYLYVKTPKDGGAWRAASYKEKFWKYVQQYANLDLPVTIEEIKDIYALDLGGDITEEEATLEWRGSWKDYLQQIEALPSTPKHKAIWIPDNKKEYKGFWGCHRD